MPWLKVEVGLVKLEFILNSDLFQNFVFRILVVVAAINFCFDNHNYFVAEAFDLVYLFTYWYMVDGQKSCIYKLKRKGRFYLF